MKQFEVGETYSCNSKINHNYNFVDMFDVISRTSKTITIIDSETPNPEPTKRKIFIVDDQEVAYPIGKYSLAPMLRA